MASASTTRLKLRVVVRGFERSGLAGRDNTDSFFFIGRRRQQQNCLAGLPDRLPARLSVHLAILPEGHEGIAEDTSRGFETYAVLSPVGAVFPFIPAKP